MCVVVIVVVRSFRFVVDSIRFVNLPADVAPVRALWICKALAARPNLPARFRC
jgi:hypothetical protein